MEQLPKEETISLRKKFLPSSCPIFYPENPVKLIRGEGQYLYDEMGQKYLDCVNNVAHVGHCHPEVLNAGIEQMSTLNTNLRFLHDEIVLCAEKLISLFPPPLSKVFFVNSGSEANDLALRLAYAHTKKQNLITLEHGFFGHTVALNEISPLKFNLAGNGSKSEKIHIAPCPDIYRGKYQYKPSNSDSDHPITPKIEQELCEKYLLDFKSLLGCERLKKDGICAFISESIQSCGGQIIYPRNYLRQVYKLIRDAGGICIADEIQTGFGRVGKWWGFQVDDNEDLDDITVVPDIVTLGKPIANGHPVAAVITTDEIAESFKSVQFMPTYGGNPVSCAIVRAVISVIEIENLMERSQLIGQVLLYRLNELKKKHQIIGDIRGVGLFIGIDLVRDRETREPAAQETQEILRRMKDEEFVLLSADGPHKNVLKIKPPLVFNADDVEFLVKALDRVLSYFDFVL